MEEKGSVEEPGEARLHAGREAGRVREK